MQVSIQFNPETEVEDARAVLDKLEGSPPPKPAAKKAVKAVRKSTATDEPSLDTRRKEIGKRTAVVQDVAGDAEVNEAHKASGLPRIGKMATEELDTWEAKLDELESIE